MRRAERLNQIVHYLRRMRRAVTARRIAEEFSICQRTVYRDIQDLMNTGVPIQGEAGVGYIIDKTYHLPPVSFDIDELEAIALGISMVHNWTDDKFAAKASSAFEKIQAVLPASKLNELHQVSLFSYSSNAKIPWVVSFSEIREAIRRKLRITFNYVDVEKRSSKRAVRPLAMVFISPVWLITAWCEKRQDFRNFRLDRMATLFVSDENFKDEKGKTLAAYKQILKRCHSTIQT